jgi:poly-beta-1,6-N-acetyl-D-glucosamine synthase
MIVLFWVLLSAIIYIYVGYPLFLLVIGSFLRRKHGVGAQYAPTVTLIIPAHNEEECIAGKLENALLLDYPAEKLQIIVSSDNSNDGTAKIVTGFVKKYPERIIFNDFKERRGKMGVLNQSVPMASGEILVFTDANAMYDKQAIRNIVRHFQDPKIGCVSGAKVITSTKDQTAAGEGLYWRIESWIKKMESRISSCAGADGAVYGVRKELYPFPNDKVLVMDDFVVSLSIIDKGYRCIFDPEIKAFEDSADNLLDEFKRKGRILAGALSVLSQKRKLLSPHKYHIFFQLWSHKVLRWMTFFFVVLLFFVNISLADILFFRLALLGQTLFHLMAILGFGLAVLGIKSKLFYIPFYFDFMAYTQVFGLVQYYKNKTKPAWEKLKR